MQPGTVIVFVFYLISWYMLIMWQFRSQKHYDGRLWINNYAFCSNLIFTYPRWLVFLLFLNNRLIRFPITLVVGQIMNCAFLIYALIRQYAFHIDPALFYKKLVLVWGVLTIILYIIIIVDHEIYRVRYNKDKVHRQ